MQRSDGPTDVSSIIFVIVACVALWSAVVIGIERIVVPRLAAACAGDPRRGLARLVVRAYCRVVHRLEVSGAPEIRQNTDPGPLVVVANHTAGIDPLLIQSECRFFIRWMMADDMMVESMADLWRWADIVPVRRQSSDSASLRIALRHLRAGGVLGLFPEGGITRPPHRIGPFLPGVGMLVAKTRARVLLIWISGTPDAPTAFASLARFSRSRVTCELIPSESLGTVPSEITAALRTRLSRISGWPMDDRTVGETADLGDFADSGDGAIVGRAST